MRRNFVTGFARELNTHAEKHTKKKLEGSRRRRPNPTTGRRLLLSGFVRPFFFFPGGGATLTAVTKNLPTRQLVFISHL